MARLELAPEVLDDFERFIDRLLGFEVDNTAGRIAETVGSLQILTHSPLIGRKVRGGKRELVIGNGARGYIALYRYIPDIDTADVLAVRSQRDAGFKRPWQPYPHSVGATPTSA